MIIYSFFFSFPPTIIKAATGKPLSKCGKCKRFMKYIHLKPQRLHCPTCNETYALPQVRFEGRRAGAIIGIRGMLSSLNLIFSSISENRTAPSSSTRNSSAPSTTLSFSSSLSVGTVRRRGDKGGVSEGSKDDSLAQAHSYTMTHTHTHREYGTAPRASPSPSARTATPTRHLKVRRSDASAGACM